MKKLSFMIVMICLLLCAAHAEEWIAQIAPYEPVLDEWRAGLAAGPDDLLERDAIETARRCVWNNSGLDPLEATGYAYADLDGDGAPELIIGLIGQSEWPETSVFEVLTLEEGQPVTVLEGWERFRVDLTYEGGDVPYGFYAEGSSSAFNSGWQHGLSGWKDVQTLEANTDFETEKTVWTLDDVEISEAEAQALIARWQAYRFYPVLTPFDESGWAE